MTKHEKIIVSAYTGYLMCNFSELHKYVEELMGRPVFTHEFASPDFNKELRKLAHDDFMTLCGEEKNNV